MAELLMIERDVLSCWPATVFETIESGGLSGWQLAGDCTLRPGTPITLPVKMPRTMGGRHIEVIGQIIDVVPNRKVVIGHQTPFSGTVTLTAEPIGPKQCRVTIVAALNEHIIEWLTNASGRYSSTAFDSSKSPLGVLVSNSGTANVFAAATENLARLAVGELNSVAGFGNRQVQIHIGDDGTDPRVAAAELVRLARQGCKVVLTNIISSSLVRLQPIARKLGLLLIYTPVNEGGPNLPEVFRLGERPDTQLTSTIPRLMRLNGGRAWFLAGNDYIWPRRANHEAHRIIRRHGGRVAGEEYEPLGNRDFSTLIETIDNSGADFVISTFVGADAVAFERQFYQAGMRERIQTLALAMDENTQEHIGNQVSEGMWAPFAYFQSLESDANREFLTRYKAHFGNSGPPVSSISQSMYDAVYFYADAARTVGVDDPRAIRRHLSTGINLNSPRGRIRASDTGIEQAIYLGCVTPNGMQIVDTGYQSL